MLAEEAKHSAAQKDQEEQAVDENQPLIKKENDDD